jgi:hypothetical protein
MGASAKSTRLDDIRQPKPIPINEVHRPPCPEGSTTGSQEQTGKVQPRR